MGKYALIIDYKYCTGCHTCEVACRKEKQLPPDRWGIKLSEQGPMSTGDGFMWNYIPIPSNLCDLCESRISNGEMPACVHHCLAACMSIVPIEDVSSVLEKGGDGLVCFVPLGGK